MTLTVILFYLRSIERSPISLYNCKATTFDRVRAKITKLRHFVCIINAQIANVLLPYSLRTPNPFSIIR